MHRHKQFTLRFSPEYPVRRWNIRVVAPNRRPDMPPPSCQIVGRVESHPAQARQQCLHPCMRRIRRGAVVILAPTKQISGNIPRRNSNMPQHRDHGVRKVLANAFAAHNRFINRRIYPRVPRHIFKVLEEPMIHLPQHRQWIVSAPRIQLFRQSTSAGVGTQTCSATASPSSRPRAPSHQSRPTHPCQSLRRLRRVLLLHHRLRHNHQLPMLAGNIEVMHMISQVIAIREYAAPRAH